MSHQITRLSPYVRTIVFCYRYCIMQLYYCLSIVQFPTFSLHHPFIYFEENSRIQCTKTPQKPCTIHHSFILKKTLQKLWGVTDLITRYHTAWVMAINCVACDWKHCPTIFVSNWVSLERGIGKTKLSLVTSFKIGMHTHVKNPNNNIGHTIVIGIRITYQNCLSSETA